MSQNNIFTFLIFLNLILLLIFQNGMIILKPPVQNSLTVLVDSFIVYILWLKINNLFLGVLWSISLYNTLTPIFKIQLKFNEIIIFLFYYYVFVIYVLAITLFCYDSLA